MRKTKEQKLKINTGITLIALIITIVIMLILASITVNVVIDGGLFNYANQAKVTTEIAREKENIQKASIIADGLSKTGRATVEEMQKAMNNVVGENIATVLDNGETKVVKFKQSGRYYEIDANGKTEQFTPYDDITPGELAIDENGNYMIESIEDLVTFSAMVNGGYNDDYIEIKAFPNFTSPTIVLMRDLDFKSTLSYEDSTTTIYNGYLGIEDEDTTLKEALTNIYKYKGFIPIGSETNKFIGTFNGQNYKIKNLCENLDTYGGLFGYVRNATIKNITIAGKIETDGYAGGIAGCAHDSTNSFFNCTNYANVSGSNAGGIVGNVLLGNASFQKCTNYGTVTSNDTSGGIIGVLSAYSSKVSYCINSGTVIGDKCGGLLGYIGTAAPEVLSCISTIKSFVGDIDESSSAGGLVGFALASIKIYNSINLGTVQANNARTVLWVVIAIIMILH